MINEVYRDFYTRPGSIMRELAEELPEPMAALGHLHEKVVAEGALSKKTKELIALGIALASLCDQSAAFHLRDALDAGATREEIREVVGMAILMGGEPVAIHGWKLLQAFESREELL